MILLMLLSSIAFCQLISTLQTWTRTSPGPYGWLQETIDIGIIQIALACSCQNPWCTGLNKSKVWGPSFGFRSRALTIVFRIAWPQEKIRARSLKREKMRCKLAARKFTLQAGSISSVLICGLLNAFFRAYTCSLKMRIEIQKLAENGVASWMIFGSALKQCTLVRVVKQQHHRQNCMRSRWTSVADVIVNCLPVLITARPMKLAMRFPRLLLIN